MNLIERYIHEVTRRLPDKIRKDIALELKSSIYDMLPEDHSEDDIRQVLETLGNPAILASEYNEKPMHLIGPRYYDVYVILLKLIMPITAIISFISIVAVKFFSSQEDMIPELVFEGLWQVIGSLIQTFFWITIIFAVIERVDRTKDGSPLSMSGKPWSPDDLKHLVYVPKYKKIRTFELACGLIWTAIWGTTYFYADRLLGIYENGKEGLHLITPAFNQEVLHSFWPFIVLLIVAEVALTIYKMVQKQWTLPLATFFTIYQIASMILLVIVFTHANLFTAEFLKQMSVLFTTTPAHFENIAISGVITIFAVFAGWGIFDVYKRASIKTDIKGTISSYFS